MEKARIELACGAYRWGTARCTATNRLWKRYIGGSRLLLCYVSNIIAPSIVVNSTVDIKLYRRMILFYIQVVLKAYSYIVQQTFLNDATRDNLLLMAQAILQSYKFSQAQWARGSSMILTEYAVKYV